MSPERGECEVTADPMRAVDVLRAGGLVGLPTETVYGLAADASNVDAVRRVFAAKGRPVDHPLIVHVAGPADLDAWAAEVPDAARRLVASFWAGPLTLLLRRAEHVHREVTGGRETVALRAPAHPLAQAVLAAFGGGLVAPSANRFGRVSPTTAADVVAELGVEVDLVLDGGPCTVGVESTIVDLTGEGPVILRRGAITAAHLEGVLGTRVAVADDAAPAVAPGMLASHYAPDALIVLLAPGVDDAAVVHEVEQQQEVSTRVGVLAPTAVVALPPETIQLEPAGDAASYAQVLYSRLREADERGIDCLVVVPPPVDGIGAAVIDRLTRAARRV